MSAPWSSVVEGDAADLERSFGGLARLYGAEGARRIRGAHVAVVGIGGVGSWVAEALARSGVAALTLIDLDQVAESNVNRQVHALSGTLGQAKVTAMRERILQIHPGCQVHEVEEFVEPGNWPALLPAPVHAVIDACDQMAAKVAMAAWALHSGACFMAVGAAGGKRHPERVEIADLAEVTHDPLMAQLRYYTDDGLKNLDTLDFDRKYSETWFFRTTFQLEWLEEEDDNDLPFALAFRLYQTLDEDRVLSYEWENRMDEVGEGEISEVMLLFRYRQRFLREWLFYEVSPRVTFPEDEDWEPELAVLFKVDMNIGFLQ